MQERPTSVRKIIHVDMDAFYASVEQRDNPSLKGKPVIVGGPANSRSVVAAASYEARKFGVRSAMPTSQAVRLCPDIIIVRPRFEAYRAVSAQIMDIFRRHSDLIEPLSLDEAFIDVTKNKSNNPSATWIAQEILSAIKQETDLSASAGVASTKFLAKIASAMKKPNSLTVITPDRIHEVLETLPIRKVPGIGRKTEEKMIQLGILTVKDLLNWEEERLIKIFGKSGSWYFKIARGVDDREVQPHRERKSVGAEDTFLEDLLKEKDLVEELIKIIERVWKRLRDLPGRTITLKVTYSDFKKITRGLTLEFPPKSKEEVLEIILRLLGETEATKRPVRLLGVSFSNFGPKEEPIGRAEVNQNQLTFDFPECS